MIAALRQADREQRTAAIVLYVDSPGGSALASDLICQAVAACRTPVVAVMGEVAASGGYYVLARAAHIVASPYTLTGSIGVVVGKPVVAELENRQRLTAEPVGRDLALFASPHRPFSAAQRHWAETLMHETYDRFVAEVARGRGLEPSQVHDLARGRVWSGADAKRIGLIDDVGDLEAGVAAARRLGNLKDDAEVHTVGASIRQRRGLQFAADPADLLRHQWPFGQEAALTWMAPGITVV